MEIYTIGFTKESAGDFFGALSGAGIEQLVDVRLNNVSQLAGFTRRDDLPGRQRPSRRSRPVDILLSTLVML